MGRGSIHGLREMSPTPRLVILFPLSSGTVAFLGSLLTCPQGAGLLLRQGGGRQGHSLPAPTSLQKKLPLMALSTTMAESFKELDPDSSMG